MKFSIFLIKKNPNFHLRENHKNPSATSSTGLHVDWDKMRHNNNKSEKHHFFTHVQKKKKRRDTTSNNNRGKKKEIQGASDRKHIKAQAHAPFDPVPIHFGLMYNFTSRRCRVLLYIRRCSYDCVWELKK